MTLPERLELFRSNRGAFTSDPTISADRLQRWKHLLGVPADQPLEKRLAALGIASDDLELLLGTLDHSAIAGEDHPDWWRVCDRVLATSVHLGDDGLPDADYLTGHDPAEPTENDSDGKADEPILFEHALSAWVDVATAMLHEASSSRTSTADTLGQAVLRREQRGLLENLSLLSQEVMLRKFHLQKLGAYSSNDLAIGLFSTKPVRTCYTATIHSILADNSAELMRDYPALARILATRVQFWVRTLTEFAEHLNADRSKLEEHFNNGKPIGALVKGGRGISDSHNGGRAVMVCTFESGTRIVFKPRSMAIDLAWNHMAEFFNAQVPAELQLKTLAVIDRGLYGWMEFASRQPCQNEDEVRLFYSRLGSLLAMVHALQGNDFHYENVVANGAFPVAIDLETISVPDAFIKTDDVALDPAIDIVSRSVLRSMLLPSVVTKPGRRGGVNMGAIGVEVKAGDGTQTHRKLIGINTDFQRWVTIPTRHPDLDKGDESKVELVSGEAVNPKDYLGDVEQGYVQAYETIMRHQHAWLADDGPLLAINDAWVRVLNRSTNIYYRLLLETCSATTLQSGVDRWIQTDRLHVDIESAQITDPVVLASSHAILQTEQAALLRGDIPYFLARGDSLQYASPDPVSGAPIPIEDTFLQTSAVAAARIQFGQMSQQDLALQQRLMNFSYIAAEVSAQATMHGSGDAEEPEKRSVPNHAALETWLHRALDQLDDIAIRHGDQLNWIDCMLDPSTEILRPSALDTGIYSGRGGMALTLERAYRHFGDARWLTLAKDSFNGIFKQATQQIMQSGHFSSFDLEGPSGTMPRAGMIAACWAMGRHEGLGAYRELAHSMIVNVTDRFIQRDSRYDVISGSAGFALLAMHLEREEAIDGLEPILCKLGDHLKRTAIDIDGVGWAMSTGTRPLCGFGHGRAGVGLALLELGARLNQSDLRDLGLKALHAEHALRGDNAGDGWPDLRSVDVGAPIPAAPYRMNAWCAGAEGISLSRAAAMQFADDAFLQDDLDYAMTCMDENQIPHSRTHLCCGSSGRSEAWRTIAALTGNASLRHRAEESLTLAIDVEEPDPANPSNGTMGLGLFQGTAGRIWAALSEVMDDDGSALMLLRV